MPKHLIQRDGRWHFKIRLPEEIRRFLHDHPDATTPKYWGKQFKQKSLKTSDRERANKLADIERVIVTQEFDTFRKAMRDVETVPATTEDLLRIAMAHFQKLRDHDETLIRGSKEDKAREVYYLGLLSQSGWMAIGHDPAEDADALLKKYRLAASKEQRDQLTDLVRRSYRQAFETRYGKHLIEHQVHIDSTFATALPAKQSKMFGPVLREFAESKKEDWKGSSADRYGSPLDTLLEIVGSSTDMTRVTPDQVRDWERLIKGLPSNRSKITALKGKSIVEAVEIARTKDMKMLKASSVNFHLDLLKAIFTYAVSNWYIERNPTHCIRRMSDDALVDEKRDPFAIDQLRSIFSAPIYVGCVNDRYGWKSPGTNIVRRGRFWVPLICLYSGLRLNECCQLWSDDIIEEDGQFYIRVRANADRRQRIKTPHAARQVPVHPELARIGVLSIMDDEKPHHLFPELPFDEKKQNYSDKFSSWFGSLLNHIDAKTKKTSFHSFRHNFKQELDRTAIKDSQMHKMMGWSPASKSMALVYGKIEPAELVPFVSEVTYNIDLSHLHIA